MPRKSKKATSPEVKPAVVDSNVVNSPEIVNSTDAEAPFVPIYGVSITKQELAELEAVKYAGSVSMPVTDDEVRHAVEILRQSGVIGFDTETRPSFKRGQSYKVSLLQLSAGSHCFLFRLNQIGLPLPVKELLEDPAVVKIGVSIRDDFRNLERIFDLVPDGFVDLQTFVKDWEIADNSLSRIYAILFGKRISKGQRLTNWEAQELTIHQQEYAALDAVACVEIYERLLHDGFDSKASPYYRVLNEPKPAVTPSSSAQAHINEP